MREGWAKQRLMKFVSWLQVISGQRLPKVDKTQETTVVDPLVKVELSGVPEDTMEHETSYVENNGETGQGKYHSRLLIPFYLVHLQPRDSAPSWETK